LTKIDRIFILKCILVILLSILEKLYIFYWICPKLIFSVVKSNLMQNMQSEYDEHKIRDIANRQRSQNSIARRGSNMSVKSKRRQSIRDRKSVILDVSLKVTPHIIWWAISYTDGESKFPRIQMKRFLCSFQIGILYKLELKFHRPINQ